MGRWSAYAGIKHECNLENDRRLTPKRKSNTLQSLIIGFAVKRPPSSPDQGSLQKARDNRLLGPRHDLEEMPPAHPARFHDHLATFLCGSWAPGTQALDMLASGKGDPHWAFLHTLPQTCQLPMEP